MSRIYLDKVDIDTDSLKDFYAKRAVEKLKIDIDAPVVLVGDQDKSKIEEWTNFEVKHRLPLLQLNSESTVLEVGCGTGRISKFITPRAKSYIGVDYVKEFIDIVESRVDILKSENTFFINTSFQELSNNFERLPNREKINRFIISGGVFMYMNDEEIMASLKKLVSVLDDNCIIYLSEPIALQERLTLNKFFSNTLQSEYSAIYRTLSEYNEIFRVFYQEGFELKLSEEFFHDDIKARVETKQWIFILHRDMK